MKIFLITLLATVFSVNLVAQSEITSQEYEVYGSQSSSLILNLTSVKRLNSDSNWLKKWIPKKLQTKSILSDFLIKNEKSYLIEEKLTTTSKYQLLSPNDVNTALSIDEKEPDFKKRSWDYEEKAWENFYKIYPNSGGYAVFSRVGFSNDNKYALLYIGSYYGWLGAEGNYYLLKKEDEKWKVQKKIRAWIS